MATINGKRIDEGKAVSVLFYLLDAAPTLEHLSGKHDQRRHAWRYGSFSKAKKSMKGFDKDSREVYKGRARKKAGLPQKPAKGNSARRKGTSPGGGAKVSDALIDKLAKSGNSATGARETLDVIDSVHSDGNLKPIPIKSSAGTRTTGAYRHYAGDGAAVEIKISTKSDSPMMTTAHEVGHFLDHKGLPGSGFSSSSPHTSPQMLKLRDALRNSEAVQGLRGMIGKEYDVSYTSGYGQHVTFKAKTDKRYVNYLLNSKEVFARAYSQYVATKSKHPQMLRELNEIRQKTGGIPYPTQWSDRDFSPISKAMDDLFISEGWLK